MRGKRAWLPTMYVIELRLPASNGTRCNPLPGSKYERFLKPLRAIGLRRASMLLLRLACAGGNCLPCTGRTSILKPGACVFAIPWYEKPARDSMKVNQKQPVAGEKSCYLSLL